MSGDDEAQGRRALSRQHQGGDDAPSIHRDVDVIDSLPGPDGIGIGSDGAKAPRRVRREPLDAAGRQRHIARSPVASEREVRLAAIAKEDGRLRIVERSPMHSGAGANADGQLPEDVHAGGRERPAVEPRHQIFSRIKVAVAESARDRAVGQREVEGEDSIAKRSEDLHPGVPARQQHRGRAGADERKVDSGREALLGDREGELSDADPQPGGELRLHEGVEQGHPAFGEVDEHLCTHLPVEDGVQSKSGEANDEGVAIRAGRVAEKISKVRLKEPVENEVEASILRGEAEALRPG